VAQQGEEAADSKSLVTVAHDLEVDGLAVEHVAEEADDAVHGDHE
jgi:hypothetical protein